MRHQPRYLAAVGEVSFRALGTVVSVLVTDRGAAEDAGAILGAELSAVDAACSRFRADSELSRLNRAGGREVAISRLFADALAAALAAAQATDGDVDPTCGRSLIGIGYDRDFAELRRSAEQHGSAGLGRRPGLGQDSQLGQDSGRHRGPERPGLTVIPAAGWRTVELDPVRGTARVPDGVLLDLGATGKALAADRAAVRIAAAVGGGVLVNLGGDIRVAGPPPAGGWRIGIADDLGPGDRGPGDTPAPAVSISSGGLATSSTKLRAWRRGGTAVHHIIVPATGQPAQTCWRTASVAAASCVDANAASTAAIIRGEGAPGWLDTLGLPARLVGHDGTVRTVSGWPGAGTGTGCPR